MMLDGVQFSRSWMEKERREKGETRAVLYVHVA